jgi:hypothetical protein
MLNQMLYSPPVLPYEELPSPNPASLKNHNNEKEIPNPSAL